MDYEKTLQPKTINVRDYSVGIIGTGGSPMSIGWSLATHLTHPSNENWLSRLYLATNTMSKAENLNSVLQFDDIRLDYTSDYSNIKNADLIVVSVDATGYKNKQNTKKSNLRDSFLKPNIKAMIDVGQKLNGYTGNVIVVSNPVETMTHLLCAYSNLSTSQVTGFNYVDSYRFKSLINNFRSETERFNKKTKKGNLEEITNNLVIGEHGPNMVPLFSQLKMLSNPFYDNLSDYKNNIAEKLVGFGPDSFGKINSTASDTVPAIYQVIKHMFGLEGSADIITASTYFTDENHIEPIFINLPISNSQNGPIIRDDILDNIDNFERNQFESAYKKILESKNNAYELIKSGVLDVEVKK